jgi:hypothetical protein
MSETSDQKPRKPKSRRYGLWMASVYLVFVFGALYLLGSGLNHFLVSNFGGGTAGLPQDVYLSQGIQMYELRFRTSAKDVTPLEAESLPRKEWILNIPRAYVVSTAGESGAYGPDDSFIARLEIVFDPNFKIPAPLGIASKTSFPASSVHVKLINLAFPTTISKVDYCVREDDYPDFLKKHGSEYPPKPQCRNSSRRCLVHADMDGWPVDIYLPKSVYFADPQPVCRAVEAFLDKYTTRRDSVK